MTDELTDEERVLAWKSSWQPSFAGKAIVNKDFTFRSVNQQFCEILGVTPAVLLGSRFQDVTHPAMRRLDEENAVLVIEGKINSYMMNKTYQFENGKAVKVLLLVTRAPRDGGEFQFFVSRIMRDMSTGESATLCQKSISTLLEFIAKHGKLLVTIGTAMGAFVVAVLKALE